MLTSDAGSNWAGNLEYRAARVVRPGGAVVVVDFVRHDREWMREELGVLWLGFAPDEVAAALAAAGLEAPRVEMQPAPSRAADLPETFVASARKPARAGGSAR